ncbi:hypothetical protein [Arthrobacter sp. ISL-72]|uniref:hypothetical protein n=1 Tax=Arthrobacter sp. ISL-72 TaxID=2819114 RepID=UPI001BECF460|nr:hypothetical protein [Arthrobacter sp. ISL-72]MBT2595050.1 hypothetical protein [Arthrobacter sp. ISL-72]
MPWWSWILIWIALVAVSLLFYVLLGIRLFRKFMATVKDLGAAGERFGAPLADLTDPAPQWEMASDEKRSAERRAVQGSAVFASPMQMRHDYSASKSSRREERRRRRVQRKADRGQPQALRDIEFS